MTELRQVHALEASDGVLFPTIAAAEAQQYQDKLDRVALLEEWVDRQKVNQVVLGPHTSNRQITDWENVADIIMDHWGDIEAIFNTFKDRSDQRKVMTIAGGGDATTQA